MTTTSSRLSLSFAAALAALGTANAGHAWAGPAPLAQADATSAKDASPPQRAFVRLDLKPEPAGRRLVVGEAVPATIRAYFLAGTGVTLTGVPRVVSDGFMFSNLSDKPRQTQTEIRGLPYTQLTWTGVLTAIKAGAASPTVELPTELAYRDVSKIAKRAAAPAGSGDDDSSGNEGADPFAAMLKQTPFASDPFFAQMFKNGDPFANMMDLGGEVRQRDVTLRDEAHNVQVAALQGNRPADYAGAVGIFEATSSLSSRELRVGEPATLTLRVRGRGSFDRLSTGGLPTSDTLTTYAVKAAFTPGPGPIEGEKVFIQTVVPRRSGALIIPGLSLSTFDPQRRRYVTHQTAPIAAQVDPAPRDDAAASGIQPVASSSATATATASSQTLPPDTVRRTLTPLYLSAWYEWLAGAMVLFAALLSALGARRTRTEMFESLVRKHRTRRAIARSGRRIRAAVAEGNAPALFAAAREALQARLSASWRVPPEAISTADVEARLGASGGQVREIFERADRLTYAGGAPRSTNEDLDHWSRIVSGELSSLERTA